MAFSLRRRLKNSYKIISDNLSEPNISAWLTDNFYTIDKHYRNCIKNKRAMSCKDFYETLQIYCRRKDYQVEAKGLNAYLSAESKHFSYIELSSLKPLLAACSINKIADLLKDGQSGVLLSNSVKLLFALGNPCFDEIIETLWAPEGDIAKYEEGYNNFDGATKAQYRFAISKYAKAHSVSESVSAKNLIAEAKRKGIPLGNLLLTPRKYHCALWCVYIAVVFSALTAISAISLGWITFLLLPPFLSAATLISDQLIPLTVPAYRAPRLKLNAVPSNAKTLVTVATLMYGNDNDEKVFQSLSRFSYMNPDKNIYFCVLADFPDSQEQYHISDSEIIKSAQSRIDNLNRIHGQRFCLFFRERAYNESELSFGGWERKRGAVCELVSHIVKGDKTEYYGGDFIRDIKYILTLDADTNLSVGSVKELLSVALHPVNRPVIKNNKVVSGYGIIQPAIRTELSSAYKTGFTRLISGTGGADSYSTAAFHRSQALFGSGSFCGKGLIDVNAFYTLLSGKIPEGLVLSHDSVEGGVLRTLALSDIALTDSTPGNTVSFFRRQHRWMRGDFQNVYFLKGKLLSPFSKWRLLLTVASHILPVFSVLAMLSGIFLKSKNGLLLLLLAYSYLLLPCVASFFTRILSGVRLGAFRFFSKSCSMLTQTASRLFFEISASPRKAVLTLHAYFLAFVRLFTRQKTLEWTTAAQAERLSSGLGKYVLDGIPSVAAGVLLLAFAQPPFVRLCGVIYFIYPLLAVYYSKGIGGGIEVKPNLNQNEKAMLTAHAKDMFAFYNENVGEKTNYLPPDNIQFSPTYSVALRTSPTNIGFYLLSLLAGCDLEIISPAQLCKRLDDSLTVIEDLEKYQGNLYNWYDISNLSVLGDRFVSTVDSGNFVVMLVALKEGLSDYYGYEPKLQELAARIERLVSETNLTLLYDRKKELFKIGVSPNNPNAETGCYDLLMSEARMTGYYAVATSTVPKGHWESLGRPLTKRRGYLGMLSWSGTAFEYLMPQLFLPLYRDSFTYESLAFALALQRSFSSPWGISESGYYAFDSEMNYQYKANGIQGLALRRISDNENIRSPYSTYLSLCMTGSYAVKNLVAFEARGMYGKYGMYEALDFNNDSGGVCVKSYMAHHVGMSLIAVLNAVKDNIFVKRFCSNPCVSSATELLQEKIPVESHIFEDGYHRPHKSKRSCPAFAVAQRKNEAALSVGMLRRGDLTALVSSNGHISLNSGEKALCNTVFDINSLCFTLGVVFTRGNKAFGCAPLYGNGIDYSFERGEGFISHIASSRDFSARVKYSMAKSCNCFVVNTRGEALKKYNINLTFEPILDRNKSYLSHVAFSRLFIESEYDKAKRILYFHRRSRTDGSHIFTLAVAPKYKDTGFSFRTSKCGLQIRTADSPMDYAFCPTDNEVGECINPFCLVRCENSEGGRATLLITCGETKDECEKNIRLARKEKSEAPLPEYNEALEQLLPQLLYGGGVNFVEGFSNCSINDLWSKSISGDYPLVVAELSKDAKTRTEELLKAFMLLSKSCLRLELIFIVGDEDKYNRPVEREIREICFRLGAHQYIGKRGGIFLLNNTEAEKDLCEALRRSACFYVNFDKDFAPPPITSREAFGEIITDTKSNLPLPIPEIGVPAPKGYFLPEGFVVDKSNIFECPYSYVLTGHRFSTVLTQNSLGYSFFDNARERRICAFFGDAHFLENGERLLLLSNDKAYDLCAVSNKVRYEKGFAVYEGEIEGNRFSVTVTIPPKHTVKLIRVQSTLSAKVRFLLKPVMGDSALPVRGIEITKFNKGASSCLLFRNPFGATFPEGVGFAGAHGGVVNAVDCTVESEGNEHLFFLGACQTQSGAESIVSLINHSFFNFSMSKASEFASSLLPNIRVKTENDAFDRLFNFFLPYQVYACRFLCRGSFYQSGGAYGFRDQLQDCLTMIYSNPKAVRTHIIRCCAHQYEDGTVMHWWHTRNFNKINRGIKSKCSDDLLYLPWITADYLEKTEDYSLLDVPVFYLSSPPLDNSERYEQPERSKIKETVYKHCQRVFRGGLKLGKRGLILMGSCDWNDAFSLIGERGEGESVFSSMLYIVSANAFIPVCEKIGDGEFADFLREAVKSLKTALEAHAFFGDRYARAFCDDGTVLGVEDSEECKIDILSQAFAVLAGLNPERAKLGLKTAFSRLYDEENQIFKLFSPPFANGKARVGYIRGYVAGIRENGGQYSHGALWGALACIKAGMLDEGMKILGCVNPVSRMANKALAKRYKVEPYVITADIYHGKQGGRGGWSWYTGAASWFYKIMLEEVYGIKLGNNQIISVSPVFPYEAEIQLNNRKLLVKATVNAETALLNGNAVSFPLVIPEGDNDLTIPCV